MNKLVIVAGLVFAFGCGKKGIDAKLDELGKIRDAMCKCTDKACADTQHEAYIAWKKGNKDEAKPDKDQMEKYESIRKEMMDCRHKLEGGGGAEPGAPGAPAAPAAGGGDPGKTAEMMAKMSSFKDEMCACKEGDKDCATKVQKEMTDFANANKDAANMKMSEDDMKKATAIGQELGQCAQKAMTPAKK